MTEPKAPRCLGIFGFLFGHKFLKSMGGYNYRNANCWRCGYNGGQR